MQKLKDAGWKKHVIELVIQDLHKPSHSIDKLQEYVNAQKLKAIPPEIIKEALIDAGWSEDLIDVILEVNEEVRTERKLKEKKTPKEKERNRKKLEKIKEEAEKTQKPSKRYSRR